MNYSAITGRAIVIQNPPPCKRYTDHGSPVIAINRLIANAVGRPPSWGFRRVVRLRFIAYLQSWNGGEQIQVKGHARFRLWSFDAPIALLPIPILREDPSILIDLRSLGNLFRYKPFLWMYPANRFKLANPFFSNNPLARTWQSFGVMYSIALFHRTALWPCTGWHARFPLARRASLMPDYRVIRMR
jgi:hypothetical protein